MPDRSVMRPIHGDCGVHFAFKRPLFIASRLPSVPSGTEKYHLVAEWCCPMPFVVSLLTRGGLNMASL